MFVNPRIIVLLFPQRQEQDEDGRGESDVAGKGLYFFKKIFIFYFYHIFVVRCSEEQSVRRARYDWPTSRQSCSLKM